MIIRESDQEFIMTEQHEHARLSGDIAKHVHRSFFLAEHYVEDVLLAIYEHDRSWIRADDTPIWNDGVASPFSFMDYPLLPKLTLYRCGLDEIEVMNRYAGLLCSIHFSSFEDIRKSSRRECVEFCQHEQKRQERLKSLLVHYEPETCLQHLRLLQLCDNLSLYVCLNTPGASKEEEHPWFRESFNQSERFNRVEPKPLVGSWLTEEEIAVTPPIFDRECLTTLKIKHVNKQLIAQHGVDQAYKQTPWTYQHLVFK